LIGLFSPFNEALGQVKAGPEGALAAEHLAGVGFVVVAGEMEEAVQDEHLDFDGQGVALASRLAERGGRADGEVAGDAFTG
jgi:hypothetical protein